MTNDMDAGDGAVKHKNAEMEKQWSIVDDDVVVGSKPGYVLLYMPLWRLPPRGGAQNPGDGELRISRSKP